MKDWRKAAPVGEDSPIGRGRLELSMLTRLLGNNEENQDRNEEEEQAKDDAFPKTTQDAFRLMLRSLQSGAKLVLSDRQRAWVKDVYEKVFDDPQYENLVSRGLVPRGKEVETPAVLRNLPLRPPGRR